jgi:hypothetical protein
LGIAPADILMEIDKYPKPGAKIDFPGLANRYSDTSASAIISEEKSAHL